MATTFDTAPYAALLKAAVRDRSVDYDAVNARVKELDAFLKRVADAELGHASDDDACAFFINAYNALVLRAFLAHGRKRVIDVPGFFDKEPHVVAKETLTLNELEERKIRRLDAHGLARDPRVHFAVNCASRDCPPLLDRPYAGATLATDLEERTRAYLARGGEVVVDESGHRVIVVQLLEWYASDFGGESAVRAFLARYVPALKDKLLDERVDLDFRPYDWSTNALK